MDNERAKSSQVAGSTSSSSSGTPAAVTKASFAAAAPVPTPAALASLPAPAPVAATAAPAAQVAEAPSPDAAKQPTPMPAKETSAAKSDQVVPPPVELAAPARPEPAATPAKTEPAAGAPAKTEPVAGTPANTEPIVEPPAKPDPMGPPAKLDPMVPPGKLEPDVTSHEVKTAENSPVVIGHPQPVVSTPPAVRLVNSKHITINYEIKDVGPSGVSSVELWCTQDGKSWTKKDVSTRAKAPYLLEVADEGLYGFTLRARNGVGLAKEAPKSGDLPQVWVEVDMTKPVVELTGIHANCTNNTQKVVIRWKASDKNFGAKPITLSYAASGKGPWTIIAANLPNTGRYDWLLPPEVPARFRVKVEASDLVGNVGEAQTPRAVLMDRAQPTVAILAVDGVK
jgi:hypothetical protein